MRRGFKAQAERISLALREQMGLSCKDRFDPWGFLRDLGILLWTPAEVPGISPDHVEQLTVLDADSWSGVTIREGNATAIIVNPTHPSTRQANTLMHEWAHIELRHTPNRVDRSEGGLMLLSDYPSEYEDEADWMSGTVLAPRDGLVFWRKQGATNDEIAEKFGISIELATWRLRMTGVDRQMRARFR